MITPTMDIKGDKPVILQQKAAAVADNLLLYNVYYNSDPSKMSNPFENLINTLGNEDIQKTSRTLNNASSNEGKSNVVKIEVDLAELRKYAPLIDPKSPKDLQIIADEITKSIQINPEGKLVVNKTKINPAALNI
jgi:hypothetical protein